MSVAGLLVRAGLAALLGLAASAHGQVDQPMSFMTFLPCRGNSEFCLPRVLADGVIERESYRKLATFLSNPKAQGYQVWRPTICFNSPGGDLPGAIELGRLIRRLGLDTCLAPRYSQVAGNTTVEQVFVDRVVCASACTFALIGGVNRFIGESSRFGVHQFFGATRPIGDANTQVTVVILAAYLEEMGVSRSLLDLASLVPPRDIRWLTGHELQTLRIDNQIPTMSQWRLDALNDGTIVATISQKKPGTQSQVSLAILKRQGQPVLLIAFTPGDRSYESLSAAASALNGEAIALGVDGRSMGVVSSVSWRIAGQSLIADVPLSPPAIAGLRSGQVLQLQVSVPRAVAQFDPSLDFPLTRMSTLLAAALK